MENKTEMTLPTENAAIIQREAANFGCVVVGLAVVGNGNARISVTGNPDKIDELMQLAKPKFTTNSEVVDMYNNGYAIEDIADELALDETDVFEILTNAGLILPTPRSCTHTSRKIHGCHQRLRPSLGTCSRKCRIVAQYGLVQDARKGL